MNQKVKGIIAKAGKGKSWEFKEDNLELLKHWKYNVSNKAKLDFLESALKLAKLRKF